MYANIIIDISHEKVDRTFQYGISEELEGQIQVGMQVFIPFGSGNRRRKGYVVELTNEPEYEIDKIKEIAGIVTGSVTAESQLIQLAWWMKEQYGSTMNQALKTVLPVKQKVKTREEKHIERLVSEETLQAKDTSHIRLNEKQKAIIEDFTARYDRGDRKPSLIHGITGSGKTEVYMELMEHVIAQGRQIIVLIPEIALTYQTVMRFYRRFGDVVSIINSRLSKGEKYDQFERAKQGEIQIMLGPRSALFTPFPNLGLIIIDEEHETAYKSETAPRYHAREVAIKRAQMNEAAVVLGSATPSLEAYTRALEGNYHLYQLDIRAKADSELAKIQVVDLREELKAGNKSIFSRKLQEMIADRLEKKEQTMMFINRRGYANFVSCRSCGEAIRCPHCDVSLTLHNNNQLVCHYCGHSVPLPKTCPSCGSPYIANFGIGTQKIEEMAKKMFPGARILRMDADTTSKKGGHEEILVAFGSGKADILIGTQMIVKGHDFPKVTLVGILAADLSLYSSDFRCGERTFQLLTQAAGRAGRDETPGDVVIQTYNTEHYSIVTAAKQDYPAFYRQEMMYRSVLHYPPVCQMLSIQFAGKSEEILNQAAAQVLKWVEESTDREQVQLIGPADAAIYKLNDIYRKILYLKQENYDILIRIKNRLEKQTKESDWYDFVMIQYDFS